MTNLTPAAGTPAADPYLRWETLGGWSAQPTSARSNASGSSLARGNRRDRAAVRCFPTLDPRARAADRCGHSSGSPPTSRSTPTTRTPGAAATRTPKRSFTATARASSARRA